MGPISSKQYYPFLYHIRSGADGDADIGLRQSRRIVYPVADHRYKLPFALQSLDMPYLVGRQNFGVIFSIPNSPPTASATLMWSPVIITTSMPINFAHRPLCRWFDCALAAAISPAKIPSTASKLKVFPSSTNFYNVRSLGNIHSVVFQKFFFSTKITLPLTCAFIPEPAKDSNFSIGLEGITALFLASSRIAFTRG